MSLPDKAKKYLAKRDELTQDEENIINSLFNKLYMWSEMYGVAAAKDDRAAELEAALIKFILESRV